jgi:hypothetical protein
VSSSRPRRATESGADGKEQLVLPGAERITTTKSQHYEVAAEIQRVPSTIRIIVREARDGKRYYDHVDIVGGRRKGGSPPGDTQGVSIQDNRGANRKNGTDGDEFKTRAGRPPPEQTAKRAKIERDVLAIVNRMSAAAGVEITERLLADNPAALKASGYDPSRAQEIAGSYSPLTGGLASFPSPLRGGRPSRSEGRGGVF